MAVARAVLSSVRNDWKTPKAVYQVLNAEFGFDFDPCPPKPKFDGLAAEWGSTSFCNPPYDQLYKWIRKGYEEHAKGKTVVFLIPARTDTKAWHEFIFNKASEVRFISGRLYFDDGGERAPFPSAIVVFRSRQDPQPQYWDHGLMNDEEAAAQAAKRREQCKHGIHWKAECLECLEEVGAAQAHEGEKKDG